MAKQVSLSFKEDEMELYNFIKSKSSPSIYIKELVEKDMNGIEIKREVKHEAKPQETNSINLSALKNIGR